MITPLTSRKRMKLEAFIEMLVPLRSLSVCGRNQCACIIIAPDFTSIYSIGYNGPARGEPESNCTKETGKCGCLHAEINALIKLRYTGTQKLTMLTTTCPCYDCAGAIINSGIIDQVIYIEAYRTAEGFHRLRLSDIVCSQFLD